MALPTTKYISAGSPNIAVTGGVMAGPVGTAVPESASAVVPAALKALGYVSEDGVAPQGERSVEAIKDWNLDIIAQLQTEHSVRFQFTLYCVYDPEVLAEVFGPDNVTVTAADATNGTRARVLETGAVLPYRFWLFDIKSGEKKLRISLPNAKITEVSEGSLVTSELMSFQVTVEAFKDEAGVKAYRDYDDGVPNVPAVPTISTFDPEPAAIAGGQVIEATGTRFTGTTAVTVGGTAAAFNVISDTKIAFVAPAKAAGDHNVVITNATGPSAATALTYA